jgi:hypothetical protein
MKSIAMLALAALFVLPLRAQVLGSLFSQKKENRKLLAQQIAALEVYKSYLQQGYTIASTGLNLIGKIKSGDFDLHRDFFGALKIVNPEIRRYAKVADIMALNVASVGQLKKITALGQGAQMSSWESTYIGQVTGRMLQLLGGTVDELITVITDSELEMKDDERIKRVDDLYAQAQQQYAFTQQFSRELSLYSLSKEKEKAAVSSGRFLQGIPAP